MFHEKALAHKVTAQPLVRTTLKPKVQGSNPAHDIFSSHYHVYMFMLKCGSTKSTIVCNTSQPACRAGTRTSE